MTAASKYTALVASPHTRWQVRCPDCGYSKRYPNRSEASAHQRRHACVNCDRMLGVSPVRAVATDGGENWTSGTKRVEHEDVVITDDCEVVDVTRVQYQRYADKTGFCPFCQSEEGVEFVDEVGPGGTYRKQRFECDCGAFGEGLWTWKAGLKEGRPSSEDSERVAPDGGHVHTSDADLAAHDHANELEAALDYVMVAARRARDGPLTDRAVARLQLAERGTRLAFFAASDEARAVGLHDATEHLEAAVESIEDEDVTHPARHALQQFADYEDGDRQ